MWDLRVSDGGGQWRAQAVTKTRSFRDAVADYFRTYPDRWLNATELESVGGRFAWRTRVSECRLQLGMDIENRTRTVHGPDGSYVVSEYKFTAPTGQLALL
jgi:hypothetical protein